MQVLLQALFFTFRETLMNLTTYARRPGVPSTTSNNNVPSAIISSNQVVLKSVVDAADGPRRIAEIIMD